MRVLMLAQFYPPIIGGEERHVRNLSLALLSRGHDVSVATIWHQGLAQFELDAGVRIHRLCGTTQQLGMLFSQAAADDRMVPTRAPSDVTVTSSDCPPAEYDYPCLSPYIYSVDLLLPIVGLRQRDYWMPDADKAPRLAYFAWVLNLIGWVVGLLIVAGFTNVIRKE